MATRSEPITRLPLTVAGVPCPKAKVLENEAELLRNLQDDVPILRHLRASFVETEYEVIDKSLWLLVVLQESTQSPIPFAEIGGRPRVRVADPFMEDLGDVRRQVEQVEGRILIAASGAASPLDGTSDGPQAVSTATIRRRIKRGITNGAILIPGLPYARSLFVEDPPSTLTQGPRMTISTLVKALENECAYLVSVRLEASEAPGVSFKFSPTRVVPMARVGAFQRAESGTRLQVAMDTGKRLHLKVVAGLAWETGDVESFELKELVEG